MTDKQAPTVEPLGALGGFSIDHQPIEKTASDGRKYSYYRVTLRYTHIGSIEFNVDEETYKEWTAKSDDERMRAADAYYRMNRNKLKQ